MIKYHIDRNSVKPVYIQLKDQLKEAIDDGRLPPLSPMPHVTTIAKEAGVSLRTADNALLDLIKDGICFRRPKKGTFVQVKNVLVKKPVCGVIGYPNSRVRPLETVLYCGIMEAAARKGIMTFLFPENEDSSFPEEPEALIRRCDRGNEFDMKGIFLLNHHFETAFELAQKFPEKKVIMLNHRFDGYKEYLPNMAAIVNDDFTGAYQIAHFVLSEYRSEHIVILTNNLKDHNSTYSERCRGFRQAAKEDSRKIDHVITPTFAGKMEEQIEGAYMATRALLESDDNIDCVFCVNDLFAYGAYRAVESLGRQNKICVSGYDSLHTMAHYDIPTVKVPYTEMGKVGMEKILEGTDPMGITIKLSPEVVKVYPKKI